MGTKVLAVQPLYGEQFPAAAISFTGMLIHTLQQGYDVDAELSGMPYIDVARNSLARMIAGSNADWTFWVDQDVCLPNDAAVRLLEIAETKNLDVVGGIYFKKHPPYDPVPWLWAEEEPKKIRPYWAYDVEKGVQPVGGMGMGCTLIRSEIFRQMRDFFKDEIWFCQNINPNNGEAMGEDVWFFDRLRTMGVTCWLDPSLSVGHVGPQIIHEGNFIGYFKLGLREHTLCLQHGWHEETPEHCPGCEDEDDAA